MSKLEGGVARQPAWSLCSQSPTMELWSLNVRNDDHSSRLAGYRSKERRKSPG